VYVVHMCVLYIHIIPICKLYTVQYVAGPRTQYSMSVFNLFIFVSGK